MRGRNLRGRKVGVKGAALLALLAVAAPAPAAQEADPGKGIEAALVLVNITTESRQAGRSFTIDNRVLPGYQPRIIQVFPATGVVMDDRNHVMAYLGYRWVNMQRQNVRIEILTPQGGRHPGQLVGIDQNLGLAVLRALGGRLDKTPVCVRCDVRDGKFVVTPLFGDSRLVEFRSAQVLEVGQGTGSGEESRWTLRINRPLVGAGEPLLDARNRVLGFVASQRPSKEDPGVITTVVYPMSQMVASAEKILKIGGDVRTGWLGVYIDDERQAPKGIRIDRVEEGGPAHKAGLRAGDVVLRFGGEDITGSRQFIRLVQDSAIGSTVKMDILRENRPVILQTPIEARRQAEQAWNYEFSFPEVLRLDAQKDPSQGVAWVELSGWTGAEAIPLTPQMAAFLEIPGQSGVLVVSVSPQQAFAAAGIQAGDVIVTVDDRRVENPQTLMSYLKSKAGKAQMVVRILRKGAEHITRVQLPFFPSRTSPSSKTPPPED